MSSKGSSSTIRFSLWQTRVEDFFAGQYILVALDHVSGLKTTSEIWKKLESLYMSKSMTNILFLNEQFYGLRMEEGANLLDHINEFNQIISQLLRVEVKVDDTDKAIILLASLSESYDNVVTTLVYGKDKLKYDEITVALLENELRKKHTEDSHGE
uniref:Retrovirus-related Pol polyprotein from transposon TNT 1-94 n=1 Tax=Nelumbo nucifera TaxID=4432 RepID=A0A822YL34_NELNU|nr:TPA_asm: hypothetical protein HUJ06_010546 [Nelumbo nucifera]